MMNRRPFRLLCTSFAVVSVAFTGCSAEARDAIENDTRTAISDTSRDAAEFAARTVATSHGRETFETAGHRISGDLTCQATVDGGLSQVAITCAGTTMSGGAAVLSGRSNELPGLSIVELNGSFVGTVDGVEVFNTERLGT